ncbi:MAG: DUF1272 domain-containing protein [Gemmatimonadetes bacterium]|nr:DUF1272 domain-containing protein [Gemmatimonadota bacterium]MEE2847183.1 DUF1272 domain-containing protein [Gemmatimonadota bacterium]HBD98839.1 DUF1272 domain-containing protein [Gemmatimonadota bacterium]HIC52560.1 DUF1272 domain-containing protein [Gemmatimonadota bacterium]HIN49340.1 DUF1272 domain-containing protein [Gemmatimonadota bacterium]
MLQLRPNCESCDQDLAADGSDAWICTFECTFCSDCAESRFRKICPNCGGELVRRPSRPPALLEKFPGSTERINKDHG